MRHLENKICTNTLVYLRAFTYAAVPEAPNGLIVLGAQLFRGLEQKGIKSLTDCLKKCATAGAGIQVTPPSNSFCHL